MSKSKFELLKELPEDERRLIYEKLPLNKRGLLKYNWDIMGRPEQHEPPGPWKIWVIKSGRGWGKTRTGSEWVKKRVKNGSKRLIIAARTAGDVRETMIEGVSGILSVFPKEIKPKYEPSKRRITFHTGAVALCLGADEPDLFRGPQCDSFWGDEVASWPYKETYDNIMFGLRLGTNPRGIITTTPRPTAFMKSILAQKGVYVTSGSTYDNKSNLAADFINKVLETYEGTTLGLQEIYGEVLQEAEGALWKWETIQNNRIRAEDFDISQLQDIVISIDPSVSEQGNEAGIIVCGRRDQTGYIIEDLSIRGSPDKWARIAINAAVKYDASIIAEVNQGGDLVRSVLKSITDVTGKPILTPSNPIKLVRATKGKQIRAEPIVSLYEQGKIKHVGIHKTLEEQLTTWVPALDKESPDRLDAMVWGMTSLLLGNKGIQSIGSISQIGKRESPWKDMR